MNSRFIRMFTPEQHTGGHLLLPDDAGQAGDGGQGGAGGGDGTGGTGGADKGGKETDWKANARTWEQRANADKASREQAERERDQFKTQLEQLRQSQMTDAEKAVEKAREEGRATGLAESAGLLVEARLDAALAGRVPDGQRKALVEALDRTRFVKDGKPDTAAITAWAEQVAPKGAGRPGGMPDLGQGRRSAAPTTDMDALIRRAAGVRTG
jgi:hypothetical protein